MDQSPTARRGAALCSVGDALVLFGGFACGGKGFQAGVQQIRKMGGSWVNDTWKFLIKTGCWHRVASDGYTPSPREGHTLTGVGRPGQERAVLFGGYCDGVYFNDLHILHVKKKQWFEVKSSGQTIWPDVRCLHTACALGDSALLLIGGVHKFGIPQGDNLIFNVGKGEWKKLDTSEDVASRFSHTACLVNTSDTGDVCLVFGGHGKVNHFLTCKQDGSALKPINNQDKWLPKRSKGVPSANESTSLKSLLDQIQCLQLSNKTLAEESRLLREKVKELEMRCNNLS